MNYPGVIAGDNVVLSKLLAAEDRPKDGHAPLLSGHLLDAYILVGIESDHECSNINEVEINYEKGCIL